MARIVRTTYRHQRPPRKRQAVPLEVPAVVKISGRVSDAAATSVRRAQKFTPPATDDRKPARIVTIRRRKHVQHAHLLEDLTPEEQQRRGDAADALFRRIVRRITETT